MKEVGEVVMKEVGEAVMEEVGEAIMKEVGEVVMKGVGDGRGGWCAAVHGVAKSWTQLSDWTEWRSIDL